MSLAAQPSADAPPATADDNIDDTVVVDDDNLSVVSEESEDLELPIAHNNVNNNVNNAVNNRRGRRELNNLGPVQNLPRLRSGRIWGPQACKFHSDNLGSDD